MDHALAVIGASGGGIPALRDIVTALPADLNATVAVVVHVPGHVPSSLPEILARSSPLPVTHAHDGRTLNPGRILVAPPDHHLEIRDTAVRLTRGPRENNHRPSTDVLFRSAARSHGRRSWAWWPRGCSTTAHRG